MSTNRVLNYEEATPLQGPDSSARMFDGLSLKESAIQYAHLGWRVFPLRKNSKKPQIKKWQIYATTDATKIEYWWAKWPDANIGILTGGDTGVFAVDIDPKNGGDHSLSALLNSYGDFPDTAKQRTGSGGEHFIFRVPDQPIRTRRGMPGDGIDICSNGGYIVYVVSPYGTTGTKF